MTKQTKGKKQWRHILDLWGEYEDLADIMDIIANSGKYPRGSWKKVPKEDFVDALMRHFSKQLKGEKVDDETGKLHWSHMAWNCLVLAWHEKNEQQNELDVGPLFKGDAPGFCKPNLSLGSNSGGNEISKARDNFATDTNEISTPNVSNVFRMSYPELNGDDAA